MPTGTRRKLTKTAAGVATPFAAAAAGIPVGTAASAIGLGLAGVGLATGLLKLRRMYLNSFKKTIKDSWHKIEKEIMSSVEDYKEEGIEQGKYYLHKLENDIMTDLNKQMDNINKQIKDLKNKENIGSEEED